MTAYFAPDTNFFLQCLRLENIDWTAVTSDTSIVLIVVKEVQREIDRHKSGGNARRAKRAREVSAALREAIRARSDEYLVTAGSHTVSVRIAPRLPQNRLRPEELDLTTADERIVEEALACSRALGVDISLLTDDMTPLLAARDIGIGAIAVPDIWLLPPEPTDTEKQLRQLQSQVEHLMGRGPLLKVEVLHQQSTITRFDGALIRHRELSPDFIDRAVEAVLSAFPMEGTEKHAYVSYFGFAEYRDDYQEWELELRRRIESLPGYFNTLTPPTVLTLRLTNEGVSSADHVVVDISTGGNICLANQAPIKNTPQNASSIFRKPPAFQNVAPLHALPSNAARSLGAEPVFPISVPTPKREFRWSAIDGDRFSQHIQGECDDFRHVLDPHIKELQIEGFPGDTDRLAGALRIRISARNVAMPVESLVPIRMQVSFQDSERSAAELIGRELGVVM